MFRSKIEVREYAMNKAIELLGTSNPVKDAVAKAEEIEKYVMGEAELPETVDENELISTAQYRHRNPRYRCVAMAFGQ